MDEVKEQLRQLKNVRLEISTVKKELNRLNREKETWFKKRAEINKQITGLISGVKGSKDERNEITGKVKELKLERDALNKEISEKVAILKEIQSKQDNSSKKSEKRVDPSQIKKQIEKMDYVLQTEPMSFKKEQQMMKQLKDLKKQLNEMSGALEGFKSLSKLKRDISKLRKKSNITHKEIQKQAADSQGKHEVVLEKSKEIDALKVGEKEAHEKFKEYKALFTEKNSKLKELLAQADGIKKILEEHNVAVEEDQKRVEAQEVKKKAKEVDEKIKKGKKLTTEDLLVFQRAGK